jgi:hypothetical protein
MKSSIEWTLSKILAFIIITIGSVVYLFKEDSEILIKSMEISGIVIAVKTGSQAIKKKNSI